MRRFIAIPYIPQSIALVALLVGSSWLDMFNKARHSLLQSCKSRCLCNTNIRAHTLLTNKNRTEITDSLTEFTCHELSFQLDLPAPHQKCSLQGNSCQLIKFDISSEIGTRNDSRMTLKLYF